MSITPLSILLALVAGVVALVAGTYLLVLSLRLVFFIIKHIATYIASTIGDALRLVGAVPTSIVLVLLMLASVVLGRWSAVSHFARGIKREIGIGARCIYRIAVAHPLRLLGLYSVIEGVEVRVVEDVKRAPGPDRPSKRTGQFAGYRIVGSLPGGGSGGKLYIAEPDAEKRASLNRQPTLAARGGCPDRVVIKSFSVSDGSSLPNMVRESRALEAAKALGLILEHDLSDARFFYVMAYVPGDDLGEVTRRLHANVHGNRLDNKTLAVIVGYSTDLIQTLDHYHRNGFWHKDVKPENIIIHDRTAHLVDFGLVTPLASAMTLTTHGTEYFRDPELVRMALRGVKVHEVDGAKFDVYAAGAVLYYTLENTFPAHGGLSRFSLKHPDALAWIVRRAMTEYNQRYETAADMLADLAVVARASDPWAVRPADLPSMAGSDAPAIEPEPEQPFVAVAVAGTPVPPADAPTARPAEPIGSPPGQRKRPNIAVTSWWTGRYKAQSMDDPGHAARVAAAGAVEEARKQVRAAVAEVKQQVRQSMEQARQDFQQPPAGYVSPQERRPAAKAQVIAAQRRAAARRRRAQIRMARHAHKQRGPGAVVARVFVAVIVCAGSLAVLGAIFNSRVQSSDPGVHVNIAPLPPLGPRVVITDDSSSGSTVRITGPSADASASAVADAPLPSVELEPAIPVEPIGKLLLVSDHPGAADADVKTLIDAEFNRFEKLGLTLLSDAELEANLHRIVGTTEGVVSDEAVSGITRFLVEQDSQDVLGMVWVAADPDDADRVRMWIITLPTENSGRLDEAIEMVASASGRGVTYIVSRFNHE
ncbi:MAG: hypothetical protein KAS72_02840 [Phycisphaerales bacterium]|nr:hypothetical protein [Phycisphaerales bacterium]